MVLAPHQEVAVQLSKKPEELLIPVPAPSKRARDEYDLGVCDNIKDRWVIDAADETEAIFFSNVFGTCSPTPGALTTHQALEAIHMVGR